MKNALLLTLIFTVSTLTQADQKQFDKLWYDGNAEISSYSLKESRYREIRDGTRVMVFVTEPMRLSTHIKPDVKLPEEEKIRVIKLNDERKFITGIYDYSVMTSIFTSVENKQSYKNMDAMKVAFSSQEWCGMVYERYLRFPDTFKGVRYSYFEKEGESEYSYPTSNVESEDNLWIRIRELNAPFLNENETKTIQLIPSRWVIRKSHKPATIVNATISKGKPELRETTLGRIKVIKFNWTIENESTTVYVEHKYPHRIVEFQERDGSSGKLMESIRAPYWAKNGNKDLGLREKLQLNY